MSTKTSALRELLISVSFLRKDFQPPHRFRRQKIIPSDKEYNYRNKITLHCKNNHFGFYENKTNNIIEIEKCLIADKNINNVLKNIFTINILLQNFFVRLLSLYPLLLLYM